MALLTSLPEKFASSFARTIAPVLIAAYPTRLADVPPNDLAAKLQSIIPDLFPQSLSLIRARPDYESVMAQLTSELGRSEAWADTDISGTGQMFLRAVAADVDYGQFSIARALQEAYTDTAMSDSAIFLAARMLGNRLTRNLSAQISATLTRADVAAPYVIPAYTEWRVSYADVQIPYFNRTSVTFNVDVASMAVTLWQGSVASSSVVSSGVPFQSVEIGNETRTISDVDLRVFVDGIEWTRVEDPLWHYNAEDRVWWENTLQNGNVEIRFGNGLTGALPPAGVTIRTDWIENIGTTANRSETDLKIAPARFQVGNGSLAGLTTSAATGGTDALTSKFFKLFASDRRAADHRAVRRQDYRVTALEFGEPIKDAGFRGQAEIAPTRPSFMNVIEATLLCDPPMSGLQWINFQSFIRERGIFQCEMRRTDPEALPLDIDADVFCLPAANLESVGTRLLSRVTAKLAPTYGSLGYSWFLNDIAELLRGSEDLIGLVEYSVIKSPTGPILCNGVQQWVKLNSLNLNLSYTTRGPYAGRKDRSPLGLNFSVSGGLQIG